MHMQQSNTRVIWRALGSLLCTGFLLLTINWLIPSRLRFPKWLISSNLDKRETETEKYNRTDYVDQNDAITLALDKNYATVLKTKDESGNFVLEEFFDEKGDPVVLPDRYSAIRKEYDNVGKPIKTEYLDKWMKPVTWTGGYSVVLCTYNTDGKVETEMYFDEKMQPTLSAMNRYGTKHEYTQDGKESVVKSLDADGKLMTHTDNYVIVKKTYSPNGELHTVMYYDENENPFRLNSGVYGYLYENGKISCLNADGKKCFSLSYFLHRSKISVILAGTLLLLLILHPSRKINMLLLVAYTAFIIYMTIWDRALQYNALYLTLPLNAYLFFTNDEIMMNIWLFVPLGATMYKLFRMWEIIAIPITVTLAIETAQIVYGIGTFELTDIIANTMGGMIGITGCYVLEPMAAKIYKSEI